MVRAFDYASWRVGPLLVQLDAAMMATVVRRSGYRRGMAAGRMEQLYNDLKREFNLEERINVIRQKVSIIARFSTFVLSRLEAQRAGYLEWIIILLIFSGDCARTSGKALRVTLSRSTPIQKHIGPATRMARPMMLQRSP